MEPNHAACSLGKNAHSSSEPQKRTAAVSKGPAADVASLLTAAGAPHTAAVLTWPARLGWRRLLHLQLIVDRAHSTSAGILACATLPGRGHQVFQQVRHVLRKQPVFQPFRH